MHGTVRSQHLAASAAAGKQLSISRSAKTGADIVRAAGAKVREKNAFATVPGQLSVDAWTRTVTFIPSQPLRPETHYQVQYRPPYA
eukprot:1746406-Rhodomonas_salina.4